MQLLVVLYSSGVRLSVSPSYYSNTFYLITIPNGNCNNISIFKIVHCYNYSSLQVTVDFYLCLAKFLSLFQIYLFISHIFRVIKIGRYKTVYGGNIQERFLIQQQERKQRKEGRKSYTYQPFLIKPGLLRTVQSSYQCHKLGTNCEKHEPVGKFPNSDGKSRMYYFVSVLFIGYR